jgi:hypothetical protein
MFQMLQKAERGLQSRVPGKIFNFAALFEHCEHDLEKMQVMSAAGDPDTMYYHQAMWQPDSNKFRKAVMEEFQRMLIHQVLSVVKLSKVPTGTVIFPSVYAMQQNRRVKTREI